MRLATGLMLLLPLAASAQPIYRCTEPDGRISIQQTPCASTQRQQTMQIRSAPAAPAQESSLSPAPSAAAASAGGTADQRIARTTERERKMLELDREIQAIETNIMNRNAVMTQEMTALRNQKRYASNNLAGATW